MFQTTNQLYIYIYVYIYIYIDIIYHIYLYIPTLGRHKYHDPDARHLGAFLQFRHRQLLQLRRATPRAFLGDFVEAVELPRGRGLERIQHMLESLGH